MRFLFPFAVISFFFICQISVQSAQYELTLYSNANYSGDYVRVVQTLSDFSCVTNIITSGQGFKSICYLGSWQTTRPGGTNIWYPYTTRQCATIATGWENVTSVSRFGPEDTTTTAITFGWFYSVKVIRVVEQSDGDLNITSGNIVVSDLYTSGLQAWTIYEGKGFTGTTACLRPTLQLERHTASQVGLNSMGSVTRGC